MKTITFVGRQIAHVILVMGLLSWAGLAQGVTFSVSPSSVSNTYPGQITLQVSGLVTGATVAVEKYLDVNTNGIIEASDWLVQSLLLADGQPSIIGGVTNLNVPYDSTPSNGVIMTQWSLPSSFFMLKFTGAYLYRFSSPTAGFEASTNAFAITDTAYEQWITGAVQCNGTNVPYAGILLFPPPSGDDGSTPVGGTVADGSGTYIIKVAPGTYQLWAFKSNYVFDTSATPLVNVSASAITTTNLILIPTDRSISGRFADAFNASIGLPGLLAGSFSDAGHFSLGFADINGSFSVPVTAGQWGVSPPGEQLYLYGYVSLNDYPTVDATSGSISGITVAIPKGTALFYGGVKDDQGRPLPGIQLSAYDDGHQYDTEGGPTDTNGNYAIAVVAANWRVSVSTENTSYSNFSFTMAVHTNITDGQAIRLDFNASPAATISGRVQGDGESLTDIEVKAGVIIFREDGGSDFESRGSARTDTNGYYTVGVAPGTNYIVVANDYAPESPWLRQYYSNTMDRSQAMQITTLTNLPATNIDFNLQRGGIIGGRVLGGGTPLFDIGVKAGRVVFHEGGGWDFPDEGYANTDTNGYYTMRLPPGTNYTVVANDGNPGSPWLVQYYSNTADIVQAMHITALTNLPSTNINFNLEQGATINGTVLAGGSPLDEANVEAVIISSNGVGGTEWHHVAGEKTGPDGSYTLIVPSGTNYFVHAWGPGSDFPGSSGWLEQFYYLAGSQNEATPVAALTNSPATNINFNLQQGALVSGCVRGDGSVLEGIGVQVATITITEGGWHPQESYYGNTDSSGIFAIAVPPGTNYYAWVNLPQGSPWLDQFFSNATDIDGAMVIEASTNGPTTNIDFNLHAGAIISGIVRGNGVPLADAFVFANIVTSTNGGNWSWYFVDVAVTESDGTYSLTVPSGTNYLIEAHGPDGMLYMNRYYNNVTDVQAAALVLAMTNAPVTGVDFNMQPIATTNGIPWVWLLQYGLATNGSADYAHGDQDGMNNIQEYIAGTDPTNSLSCLRMDSLAKAGGGAGVVLQWESVSGKVYVVNRSTNLVVLPPFITLASNIAGQATSTTYTDTNTVGSGPYFYRIGVQMLGP